MDASRPGQDVFWGHPVHFADRQDPLALLEEFRARHGRMRQTATGLAQPRLGFGCLWDKIPERTWSYSAWNLRAALRLATDTTDLGVQIPPVPRTVLQAIHTRRHAGRLITTWYYSRLAESYVEHALRRELARIPAAHRCDAVLTIHDLAALPVPFFVYTDISWDGLAAMIGTDGSAELLSMTPSSVARRRERQLGIYQRATGIITMSRWLARNLVEQTGMPPAKIHVVHPGLSAGWQPSDGQPAAGAPAGRAEHQLPQRAAPRRRLLFIGRRDFYRKGGDLVLAALAVLRREHDPRITLTVAGPHTWPVPGTPPDGVRFLGCLPPHELAALYDRHDLFVMPSRMEGFGIVFVEALARGLPCVARDAFAMPEIVTPGVSGAMVSGDDEHELAATIAATLADDALYERCHERAPGIAEYFSWERTALQVCDVIAQAT
jgi:glycosyltransferase involved in cell wall biosynthesis